CFQTFQQKQAVLHFDGAPSAQKSNEREHRATVMNKSIAALVENVDHITRSSGTDTEVEEEDEDPEKDIITARGSSLRMDMSGRGATFNQLPTEIRPVFCPTAGFGDVFQMFQETALVVLLWGTGANHPTRPFLEHKVCTSKEADRMAKNEYGELLKRLFIGDPDSIRDNRKKRQTTYGKRTTTIRSWQPKAVRVEKGKDQSTGYQSSIPEPFVHQGITG
ncbi:hypothetical protein BGZ65_012307, partial [Modicella reniformis]